MSRKVIAILAILMLAVVPIVAVSDESDADSACGYVLMHTGSVSKYTTTNYSPGEYEYWFIAGS